MLKPCSACKGTGRAVATRDTYGYPNGFTTCRCCRGDGTQVRADLELLADALATPGGSDA